MIRVLLFVILSLFLSACDDDSIKDDSLDDKIAREAMCVVASERFLLYDEAARHKIHGLEAGKDRFERSGKENDFMRKVYFARFSMIKAPKAYLVELLTTQCGGKITSNQFNDA